MFQAISITQSGRPEDKLELAFRLYDIDRNGSIEEGEMTEIIRVRNIIVNLVLKFISKTYHKYMRKFI